MSQYLFDMQQEVELRNSHAVLLAALNKILNLSEGAKTASIAREAIDSLPASLPRFPSVSCSQCGLDCGPGNAGFSSCADHANRWLA